MKKNTPLNLNDLLTEHQIQSAVFNWANAMCGKYPELKLLYAIPNQGKRTIGAASYMKAEGLKAGVPDMCLPVKRGVYGALYIEQKSKGGRLTVTQSKWLRELEGHGNCCRVSFSLDQTITIFLEYLGID
jgi:hypothetical protein